MADDAKKEGEGAQTNEVAKEAQTNEVAKGAQTNEIAKGAQTNEVAKGAKTNEVAKGAQANEVAKGAQANEVAKGAQANETAKVAGDLGKALATSSAEGAAGAFAGAVVTKIAVGGIAGGTTAVAAGAIAAEEVAVVVTTAGAVGAIATEEVAVGAVAMAAVGVGLSTGAIAAITTGSVICGVVLAAAVTVGITIAVHAHTAKRLLKHRQVKISDVTKLEAGDHISFRSDDGHRQHAIVECESSDAGELKLFYLVLTKKRASVQHDVVKLSDSAKRGHLLRHKYTDAVVFSGDNVVERARHLVDVFKKTTSLRDIKPTIKDSEDFANWCQRGMTFTDLLKACWMVTDRNYCTKVKTLNDVKKGDHVLFKKGVTHRHHAIVEDVDRRTKAIQLVYLSHGGTRRGIVRCKKRGHLLIRNGNLWLSHYDISINPSTGCVAKRVADYRKQPEFAWKCADSCDKFATWCTSGQTLSFMEASYIGRARMFGRLHTRVETIDDLGQGLTDLTQVETLNYTCRELPDLTQLETVTDAGLTLTNLTVGDHIAWRVSWKRNVFRIHNYHHAIVVDIKDDKSGDKKTITVVHFSAKHYRCNRVRCSRNANIETEDIDVGRFVRKRKLFRYLYNKCYSVEETINRARRCARKSNSALDFNNCEHFATWCKANSRDWDFTIESCNQI